MDNEIDSGREHTHPCGHDCMCLEVAEDLCDRCHIAETVIGRHHLVGISRGQAMARLYLAMQMAAGEYRPQLVDAAVDLIANGPMERIDGER